MKILIDMNLSPEWSQVLNDAGFEAIHWSSLGDPRASDRVIMDWARANSYVVFTHDLDFGALLAATKTASPSVIQVRTQNVLPEKLASLVIAALQQFAPQLESGSLVTIDQTRSRVRILPIN